MTVVPILVCLFLYGLYRVNIMRLRGHVTAQQRQAVESFYFSTFLILTYLVFPAVSTKIFSACKFLTSFIEESFIGHSIPLSSTVCGCVVSPMWEKASFSVLP
jgi:hypothetical protein